MQTQAAKGRKVKSQNLGNLSVSPKTQLKPKPLKVKPRAPEIAVDYHERKKDFLTDDELVRLLDSAKDSRYGKRDHLLCLLMFRHGLRISEALRLKISNLEFGRGRIWINRLKGGLSTEHPIAGDELRAIKHHLRDRVSKLPWLFLSERNTPMTRQSGNYILNQAAKRAGIKHLHPHMMRHSCGFFLANAGYDLRLIQDYLGHRDPKHTARYTRVASVRFEGLWGEINKGCYPSGNARFGIS